MQQTSLSTMWPCRLLLIALAGAFSLGCDLSTTSTAPAADPAPAAQPAATSAANRPAAPPPTPAPAAPAATAPVTPASAANLTPGARPVGGLSGWYEDRERGLLFVTSQGIASQVIRAGWMHDDASNGKLYDGLPKANAIQLSPGVWSVGRPLASFGKPDGWLVNMSRGYTGPVTERNAHGGWHNIAIQNGSLIPPKPGKG